MLCEFELESTLKDYILDELNIQENKQVIVGYFLKKINSDFDHEFGTESGVDFETEQIHIWIGDQNDSVFLDIQLKQKLTANIYNRLLEEIEKSSEDYKVQLLEK